MKKALKIIGGIVAVLLVIMIVFAKMNKVKPVSWANSIEINASSGVAIDGFDVVAYHTTDQSVMGSEEFTMNWREAEWRFSSQENLDLFKGDPEKYAPRLGGYCAFAVSTGFTANCSKEAWHIEEGRLYLFNNEEVKQKWLAERPNGIIEKTEANWN